MQAARRAVPGCHGADDLATEDPVADLGARVDRFICRAHGAVGHDDDGFPPNGTSEGDNAGSDRTHGVTHAGGEVDTAVTGMPALGWRIETANDGRGMDRPVPGGRIRGCDRAQGGQHAQAPQGDGGQVHPVSLRPGHPRAYRACVAVDSPMGDWGFRGPRIALSPSHR